MTESSTPEHRPSIYLERAGKGSREIAERLLEAPSEPLSTEEIEHVQAFEAELCDSEVEDKLTLKELLRQHKGEDINAPPFFAQAFLDHEVHIEGMEGQLRQFRTAEDVFHWLAQSAHDGSLTPEVLRELSLQSSSYYKAEAAKALLTNSRPTEAAMVHMSIVVDPKKTLKFARGEMRARQHLLDLREDFGVEAKGEDGADKALTDIYLKRVNGLIAADIPVLELLVDQSQLINDAETVVDAYQAMPANLRETTADPRTRVLLNKRLDYIRNGIGYDEEGKATAVDADIFDDQQADTSEAIHAVFTSEQKETLQDIELSADEIKQLFAQMVASAGLLSSETPPDPWIPGRGKRAADDLFQVVKHPTKPTFAVDSIDGVVLTPNGPRTLYDVIVTGIHELEHVNQGQADRVLGQILQIGEIRGRRISMLRETGANLKQRRAERELFGQAKPVAVAYARAIQRLESGGDMFEATKVFFEEKRKPAFNMTDVAAAKEAADRILRLMLSGGSNSQPMSYVEEKLMAQDLEGAPPEVAERALVVTNLDLDDQERLHKYGLLPIPDESIDWTSIVLQTIKPYIDAALAPKSLPIDQLHV